MVTHTDCDQGPQYTHDEFKLMQTQDLGYLNLRMALKKFDAAKHFDTAPELVGRTHNRPRMETLRTQEVVQPSSERALEKMDRKLEAGYKELEQRIDRLGALKKVAGAMQTQRNLQGKGMRRKVKKATDGNPAVYKWRKERKK
eukprot:gene20270-33518_t